MKKTIGLMAVMGLGLVGCGSDGGTSTPDAAPTPHPDAPMATPDASMATPDAPVTTPDAPVSHPDAPANTPDAPVNGPDASGTGGTGFGDAIPLTVGNSNGQMGVINPAGNRDYYKFTGTAGQTVLIAINANPMDDPTKLDTVIQVYDSSMTKIAENDDAIPRTSTDSAIVMKLPADGDYYVVVMDWSDWTNTPPLHGGPTFTYTLEVLSLGPGAGSTFEPATDPGNDAASAITMDLSGGFSVMVGDFNSDTDVDVYKITTTASTPSVIAALSPGGATGDGSRATPAPLELRDSTGTTVLARQPDNTFGLQPPLAAGNYLLYVSRVQGTGSIDFYSGQVFTLTGDNPPETEPNNTLAQANALTMTAGTGVHQGYILAKFNALADVDYFSFTSTAGAMVTVGCGSASEGSGVVGLHAEVRNASDAALSGATANEDVQNGLQIMTTTATAGTYYLRVTATSQDPTNSGNWIRCGVTTTP